MTTALQRNEPQREMGLAVLMRRLHDWKGAASLYRLDPPLVVQEYDFEQEKDVEQVVQYVVVSATVVPFSGPETYIFPADADGTVPRMLELSGSERGVLDHQRVLERAGYLLTEVE